MSKGPGKIERAVAALFADPTRTWTAEDLAVEVYGDERGWPDQNKGHRVAVLRAARRVAARLGWRHDNLHGTGTGTMLFYRADNETSFVAMRLRRRQRYIGSAEAAEWVAEEGCSSSSTRLSGRGRRGGKCFFRFENKETLIGPAAPWVSRSFIGRLRGPAAAALV